MSTILTNNNNKANKAKRNRYYQSKKPKSPNKQRHFSLLNVDFHQTTEAYLGPAGAEQRRTLGHVDRAYVFFTETKSEEENGDGMLWPAPATLITLAKKVYAHRLLGKADSFVSLLEVNVQQKVKVEKEVESSPNEILNLLQPTTFTTLTKYSFLMAVLSLPGQSDLIVVPLSASAFLRPGAKCFELLSKVSSSHTSCHQRPYHLISGSSGEKEDQTSLVCGDYRCLLVQPPDGWLFLFEISNFKNVGGGYTPSLLTANQYVALSEASLVTAENYFKNERKGRRFDGGNQNNHQHLPSQNLLPSSGDGVIVKYGAIITLGGQEQQKMTFNDGNLGVRRGGRRRQLSNFFPKEVQPQNMSANSFIFIGEFASPVISFSRLQARLNLAALLAQEVSWPALPQPVIVEGGGKKEKVKKMKKKKLAKVDVEVDEEEKNKKLANLSVEDAEGKCSQLDDNFDPSKTCTTTEANK